MNAQALANYMTRTEVPFNASYFDFCNTARLACKVIWEFANNEAKGGPTCKFRVLKKSGMVKLGDKAVKKGNEVVRIANGLVFGSLITGCSLLGRDVAVKEELKNWKGLLLSKVFWLSTQQSELKNLRECLSSIWDCFLSFFIKNNENNLHLTHWFNKTQEIVGRFLPLIAKNELRIKFIILMICKDDAAKDILNYFYKKTKIPTNMLEEINAIKVSQTCYKIFTDLLAIYNSILLPIYSYMDSISTCVFDSQQVLSSILDVISDESVQL